MPYGLKDIELEKLSKVFAANERIERVVLYGSRAKGNYKPFSDVDITLIGEELTHTDLNHLSLAIDDLLLPYQFDISIFHTLKNEALIDHIHRVGITIYERESEWKEYKLGELIRSISETYKFKPNEKVVFLNTSDILDGKFLTDSLSEASTLPGQAKKKIQKGDILYSEIRPANKRFALVDFDCDNYVVSTKLMVLRCNDYVYNRFIYNYLTSKEVLEYLQMVAEDRSGTFPQITFDIIANMDIELPTIEEQKQIGGILTSLDDKIDLLHRENATLEAMAETLFRQWFVVEAKEEWEEGKLGDILSVKGGTTPSTKEPSYWDGDIAWTSPRDVTTLNGLYLFDTEKKITQKGLEQISSGLLPEGTLLMSSRAPVGVLAFAEIPLAINQGYIAILDDKGCSKEFIYLWLKTNMDLIHSYSNGSTFMEISKSVFKSLDLLIPSQSEVEEFVGKVKPYFEKIRSNEMHCILLFKLKNLLLPRLMSNKKC